MLTVECTTERHGGVTLVTAVVENEGPRRRVELAAAGEVWPPRRRGVPASGWDGDRLTLVLDAGERRAVGYATPDDPDDPLSVVRTDRPTPSDGFAPVVPVPAVEPTPDGVVRALGDATPPRAAVPSGAASPQTDSRSWLDDVERRVTLAETLADADTLAGATEALAATGGLSGVRRLVAALERDGEALAARRDRLRDVAERRTAVSVPVETFERLA